MIFPVGWGFWWLELGFQDGLERQGAVEVYQQTAPTGRMRKYYHLTKKGELLLKEEEKEWKTYARAVNAVLESCVVPGQA